LDTDRKRALVSERDRSWSEASLSVAGGEEYKRETRQIESNSGRRKSIRKKIGGGRSGGRVRKRGEKSFASQA